MMTVLLIEDNVFFRRTFKEALLAYVPQLQIIEAPGGVRALELVQEFCPQVIFMDLKLPGESGLELTRKIRHLAAQANIIIFTAHSPEPEYLEAAQEAGANHFVPKGSLSMEEIVGLISSSAANG